MLNWRLHWISVPHCGALEEALTHKRISMNMLIGCRVSLTLEFLADSVLGWRRRETFFHPGNFHRSGYVEDEGYLVNKNVLFDLVSSLQLEHTHLGRGRVHGGRQKQSIVANAVEAISCVFLTTVYETVGDVILACTGPALRIVSRRPGKTSKRAQERCQGAFGVLPDYRVIRQEGEEHRKIFTVHVFIKGSYYGRGVGKSKKDAQMAAAREALDKLAQLE